MATTGIITALDREIAYLQQVRALLAGTGQPAKRRREPPNGSGNASISFTPAQVRAEEEAPEPSQESPDGPPTAGPLGEAVLN